VRESGHQAQRPARPRPRCSQLHNAQDSEAPCSPAARCCQSGGRVCSANGVQSTSGLCRSLHIGVFKNQMLTVDRGDWARRTRCGRRRSQGPNPVSPTQPTPFPSMTSRHGRASLEVGGHPRLIGRADRGAAQGADQNASERRQAKPEPARRVKLLSLSSRIGCNLGAPRGASGFLRLCRSDGRHLAPRSGFEGQPGAADPIRPLAKRRALGGTVCQGKPVVSSLVT
jgi:hypothetical protein